jgi:hypothetical protein
MHQADLSGCQAAATLLRTIQPVAISRLDLKWDQYQEGAPSAPDLLDLLDAFRGFPISQVSIHGFDDPEPQPRHVTPGSLALPDVQHVSLGECSFTGATDFDALFDVFPSLASVSLDGHETGFGVVLLPKTKSLAKVTLHKRAELPMLRPQAEGQDIWHLSLHVRRLDRNMLEATRTFPRQLLSLRLSTVVCDIRFDAILAAGLASQSLLPQLRTLQLTLLCKTPWQLPLTAAACDRRGIELTLPSY